MLPDKLNLSYSVLARSTCKAGQLHLWAASVQCAEKVKVHKSISACFKVNVIQNQTVNVPVDVCVGVFMYWAVKINLLYIQAIVSPGDFKTEPITFLQML